MPAQKGNPVMVRARNLELRNVKLGNSAYLIYYKRNADGPVERMTLARIRVESTAVNGRKVFAIIQQWYSSDEVVHTSKTLHDANDFSTVFHETWWKRLGYTATFDFIAKQVDFKGEIEAAKKAQIVEDFNQSFEKYNVCWHSDLIIFHCFHTRKAVSQVWKRLSCRGGRAWQRKGAWRAGH